jgi:hypothetical protein
MDTWYLAKMPYNLKPVINEAWRNGASVSREGRLRDIASARLVSMHEYLAFRQDTGYFWVRADRGAFSPFREIDSVVGDHFNLGLVVLNTADPWSRRGRFGSCEVSGLTFLGTRQRHRA